MKNKVRIYGILMAIISVAILPQTASGQSGEGLQLGARLGMSVSYFGETAKFEGGNPGLILGASMQYNLIDLLGVGVELTYHQQRGTRNEMPVIDPAFVKVTERNLTMNTLEIPVLAIVNLPEIGGLGIKLKAGYSFAYNMGVMAKDVNHYYFNDGNYVVLRGSENLSSDYNKIQHALIGSVGLAIPLDSGIFSGVSFDVRYRRGLSDIETSYSVLGGKTGQVRSQSLQVVLGFTF
jgi:hypothetical protein